jgi:hypothetical protein
VFVHVRAAHSFGDLIIVQPGFGRPDPIGLA